MDKISNTYKTNKKRALGLSLTFAFCICICLAGQIQKAKAQSVEVQRLLLDVTKLSQFKQLLQDLQTSYEILNKGYSRIKDIAAGNFSLHEAFIDGLLMVNPSIAKYRRVADIIRDEMTIATQYKAAFKYFRSGGRFSANELNYLSQVYANLVDKSVDNLDALMTVLSAGKLSMTDAERLTEINRLYTDTHKMLGFLMVFNDKVSTTDRHRQIHLVNMADLKKIQGLDKQ